MRLQPLLRVVFGMLCCSILTSAAIVSQANADVGTPEWWSGKCDKNNHPGSDQLSTNAIFNGVIACGPGPLQGGYDYLVYFTSGAAGHYEWECTELAMRYLYQVYGQIPYLANGYEVVANYPGNKLTKVNNDGTNLPSPGDVFSVSGTNANGYMGHTGIITAVNVTSGNGTVSTLEENGSSTGTNTLTVTNNILGSNVTGWLHDPNASATVRTVPTSDGHVQMFRIASGSLAENWYDPSDGSSGVWTGPIGMPSTPTGTPAAVVRPGQNVVDVFVRGSNNQIYQTWYNFQYGTWGGWIGLGGGPLSFTSDPQVKISSDNNEQVFGTGGGRVVQNWFKPSNGTYGSWTTSAALGASASGSPAIVPRAGQNVMDAFVRGANNQIYETWYNYQTGGWGGWIGMGGGPLSVTNSPQAVATSDGHIQVFGTGGGYVEQNWFSPATGAYGGWTTSPGLSASAIGSPALAPRPGQTVITAFTRSANNQAYTTWYNWANGSWGGWIGMGGGPKSFMSNPQSTTSSDGHNQIFGTGGGPVEQNWFNPGNGAYGGWVTF